MQLLFFLLLNMRDKSKFKERRFSKNFSENKFKKDYLGGKKDFSKTETPKKEITWIYSKAKNWDYGFVDIPWISKGFFVYPDNRNWAFHSDEVEAVIKTFRGREEAIIKKVIKRNSNIIIWTYNEVKKVPWKVGTYWFVVPKNSLFESDIFVAGAFFNNVKDWDIVWVEIYDYSKRRPEWKIVKVFGHKWDKWVEIESFIMETGFKTEFNETVLNTLKNIKKTISKKDIKKRVDLRGIFTFTIDSEDAKDLDDAISIKKKENGDFKLYVHIADVAEYVVYESELDKEALKRWTSVYLADRVLPMLPSEISNWVCSLNQWEDKLTLTCEMTIWQNWVLKKTKVYESIINSNYRLTYKKVSEILETWEENDKVLKNDLFLAEELRLIIEKNKIINWVLNFDFPETKVILDEEKNVLEIKKYPRYLSNKMIEEFMIICNEAISRKFSTIPFLYRIHPEPLEDDINNLKKVLALFSIDFKFKDFSTKEFAELLKKISSLEDSSKKIFLEKVILRSLSKAVYSAENSWHFGLWLQYYSHFTSPIRRYPDLQIHRIIKESLASVLSPKKLKNYKKILEEVAVHSSNQERKAEKLEYKVRDYFIVQFYKNKVWETFEAIIVTILPNGMFVQLPDTSEGFIPLISKEKKSKPKYVYEPEFMRMKNLKTWKFYNLWDKLNVNLVEADEENLRLNFEIKK